MALDFILIVRLRSRAKRAFLDWKTSCNANALARSRTELVDQFADLLWNQAPYLMLQRMSIVAPLLGVLLTVFGLLGTRPDAANNPLNFMTELAPLYIGVGMGAALAIFHQLIILSWAGAILGRWRHKAETEIRNVAVDPVAQVLETFGKRIQLFTQELDKQIEGMRELAEQRVKALETRLANMGAGITEATDSCKQSSEALSAAANQFKADLQQTGSSIRKGGKNIKSQLANWSKTVAAANAPVSSSITDFSEAAKALRNTLDEAQLARQVAQENELARRQWADGLAEATGQFRDHTMPSLRETIELLNKSADLLHQKAHAASGSATGRTGNGRPQPVVTLTSTAAGTRPGAATVPAPAARVGSGAGGSNGDTVFGKIRGGFAGLFRRNPSGVGTPDTAQVPPHAPQSQSRQPQVARPQTAKPQAAQRASSPPPSPSPQPQRERPERAQDQPQTPADAPINRPRDGGFTG
jgi:hypothetical protein